MMHSEIYKGGRSLYQKGHTSLRVLATYYWDYCLLLDVSHAQESDLPYSYLLTTLQVRFTIAPLHGKYLPQDKSSPG